MASLGSWEHDLITGEVLWSPNFRRMMGMDPPRTKASENIFWELMHPEDREGARRIIEWAMKDVQPFEYQARFILPNGSQRTFLVRGKPVVDSERRVVKRIGVTQDITERIEAQRALLESEGRYRDLIENSTDLICTHDLQGVLLWMNDLPARILGYTAREMIGRSLLSFLSPRVQHLFATYLKEVARDGYARGLMVLITRSGEERIWEYENTLRTEGVPVPIVRGMAHDVTELIRTQRALRLSESRLKALVNSLNEVVYELDCEDRILNVWTTNPAGLSRPLEELLGMKITDLKGAGFSALFGNVLRRIRESGRGEEFEYLVNTPRGERWHLASVTMICAVQESKSAICVLVRDITEKKQADLKLRKQEALLAQAEQVANLGSWEGNLKTGQARWSDNFYRMIGVEPQSIPATLEGGYEHVHPDERAFVRAKLESAVRENREYDNVTRYVLPDGRVRFLHSRGIPVHDEKGDVIGLIGASQDITEQRQAQQDLQESERLARLRLAELDQIYKTAPVGLCFVDADLRYVRINEVLAAMNGRPASEHIGRTIREMVPEMAEEIEALYRRVFESGAPLIGVELQRPSDATLQPGHYADVSLYPLKNESGSILGFNVVVQDITERKETENTLRYLSGQLLHLQDEERRRIARELHETTAQDLAALHMCLGEIQRSELLRDAATNRALTQCLEISDKLIAEVRTLSYVLHPPFLEEAGLKVVVPWFTAGFSQRSGIEVEVELSDDLRPLPPGYETALFRIMQESLMNVHRHSGSHWARVRIQREDQKVTMEIQDRGKGMPVPCKRSASPETHLGVGISGIRERVKQLGGTCAIESKPGQGVTLRVILPLAGEAFPGALPQQGSTRTQLPNLFGGD